MMKILKFTGIALAILMISLFIYSNMRVLSPTEKLAQVNLISYKLQKKLSDSTKFKVEKAVSKTKGVTACSISRDGHIASIVFRPDVISETELTSQLSQAVSASVKSITFPETGGCPIHKVTGSVDRLISFFDLRN